MGKRSQHNPQRNPKANTKLSNPIQQEMEQIQDIFGNILKNGSHSDGLTKEEFEGITVEAFGLSKYCNSLLFDKILSTVKPAEECEEREPIVSSSMLIEFWFKYFSANDDFAFR